MEKWIATSLLLALLLFCGLRATRNNPLIQSALAQLPDSVNLFDANTPEPSRSMEADSIPKRKQKITRDDGKQRVEMELSEGKIVRLNVDGQEIPAADFPKYSELTNDVRRDVTPPPPPPGFPALAPAAPLEPFDPVTPMAPMSPMSPRAPLPAAAPRAFYFGGPGEVSAAKDKDGNVVLRVEQDGEPVELIVKDGSVWHNGRKLEEGEKLKLMGGDDVDGYAYSFWNDLQGHAFHLDDGNFNFSGDWGRVSKEALEEARVEMDRRREHLREARELTDEQRREMEREMAKAREQMKRAQDEMRQNIQKQQAEMRRAEAELRRTEAEMARAEREMARSQSDTRHSQAYAWGPARSYGGSENRVSERILAELKSDGLVKNTNKYSYSLSQKKMEVNGKKQSSEQHQKYLKLYEESAGKTLNGTISFSVNREEGE